MLEHPNSLSPSRNKSTMAPLSSFSTSLRAKQIPFLLTFIMLLVPHSKSISFRFPHFDPNNHAISYQGDAFSTNGVLELTRNQVDDNLTFSVGRASYYKPVQIWNASTGALADFASYFSFVIKNDQSYQHGDGMSFFMAPVGSQIPENSTGGLLGLFSPKTAIGAPSNQILAVEFDSYSNDWDPPAEHLGINIDSISSVAEVAWNSHIQTGTVGNALVLYEAASKILAVYISYDGPVFKDKPILSYTVDLGKVLPEYVKVGFSAATGQLVETHSILTWDFFSNFKTY